MEKLFPININPNLCVRCQKCSYSCPPKAIFFKNSLRYVDYNKCRGCLKCMEVCERNSIEVISMQEGNLIDFKIDNERCQLCKKCLEGGFCFQDLYLLSRNEATNEEEIIIKKKDLNHCQNCLKCVSDCPFNAIIPIIIPR